MIYIMAIYPAPTGSTAIFDGSSFIATDDVLTIETGKQYFLSYPNAQGTENMLDVNVAGDLTTEQINVDDNITYPDNTQQISAYTGAGALAGSYTLTNLTINSAGRITALSSGTADTTTLQQNIVSAKSTNNYPYTTWTDITMPTNTQYVDIYTIGGGGAVGNWDYSSFVPQYVSGASGGSGGFVLNKEVSLGQTSQISVFMTPQYVAGSTNSLGNPTNSNDVAIWTGTFTQSQGVITIVSTTSGALQVGAVINFTKANYESAYPTSIIPYGAYVNQLILQSGSGSTWNTSTGQALSTAITASAYMPTILWEGTFQQTGTTATAITTTSGSFDVSANVGNYVLVNGSNIGIVQQAIIGNVSAGNLQVNASQNISSPYNARILAVPFGTNVMTKFDNLPSYVSNYTYPNYPYIAWVEGGGRGGDGTINNQVITKGDKGYGGGYVSYYPSSQVSYGTNGSKSTTDTPFPQEYEYVYGGQVLQLYGKNLTIGNTLMSSLGTGSTFSIYETNSLNIISSSISAGFGGVVIFCYGV